MPITIENSSGATAIRPFTIPEVPEAQLEVLRERITITELARYWATDYDWRKCEAKLTALPQFTTEIDGVDIHFIHVKSPHANALPLIITHGWPGSVLELLGTVGPLTDPTAHGGTASDAFDLVLPSLPGFGFSAEPAQTGWDPGRIARVWADLMRRLGYTRYVAQGSGYGYFLEQATGLPDPPQLGPEGLPHLRLLSRGRPGRPLRRLGRARTVRDRNPGRVQVTALAARSPNWHPTCWYPDTAPGWRAQHALAAALPDSWIQGSSGTQYHLTADRRPQTKNRKGPDR